MAGLNTRTGQRNVDYVPRLTAKEARPSSTIVARNESPRATQFTPGQMTEQFANRNTPQSQPNSLDVYARLAQDSQQQAGQAMQQAIGGYQQMSQVTLDNQKNMETFRSNQQLLANQQQAARNAFNNPQSNNSGRVGGFDTMMGDTRTTTWSSVIPGQMTPQQAQLEMARMQFEQGQHRNAIDRQNEDARNRAATQQAQIGAEAGVLSSMFGSLNNQGFRYW